MNCQQQMTPTAKGDVVKSKTGTKVIPLGQIERHAELQPRAELNAEAISDYADAMQDGAKFPPVTVFFDGERYWLADGYHRVAAAEQVGYVEVDADVRQGDRRDAVLHAAGANAAHGLRRTNADKRRAVEMLLKDEEWRAKSDRWIAERCGVSHPTVAGVREQLTGKDFQSPAQRTGRDGRVIDTSSIGSRPLPEGLTPEAAAILKRSGISVGQAASSIAHIMLAAERGGPSWQKRIEIVCRPNVK